MMTLAINNDSFKYLLKQNIENDFPYTTFLCKRETIGNLTEIGDKLQDAKKKFEEFKQELSLKFLEFKQEYLIEGQELFDRIISLGIKIKNRGTFLKDCVNIMTLLNNNVKVFFSNDEELGEVCKRMKIRLEFIRIADSSEKVVKDFWNSYQSKHRYHKKDRKVKR